LPLKVLRAISILVTRLLLPDRDRRQGLSIVDADGVTVTDSVFKKTHGTRPSAGIDLEPDEPAQKITNICIQGSKFLDNAGSGIRIACRASRAPSTTFNLLYPRCAYEHQGRIAPSACVPPLPSWSMSGTKVRRADRVDRRLNCCRQRGPYHDQPHALHLYWGAPV
jgi:hypothetical protein